MVVQRTVESLSQALGRSPKVSEIAEATEYSEEEVYDTFDVGQYGRLLSLEAEYEQNGNGDSPTVLDYLGANDSKLDEMADQIYLKNTIGGLSGREKTIILLKFYSGLSQSKIAGRLGISQMHVSRLQRNALGKLKASLVEAANGAGPAAAGRNPRTPGPTRSART